MAQLEADHANMQAVIQWALQMQMDETTSITPLNIRAKALQAAGTMALALSQYERTERHFMAGLTLAYQLEYEQSTITTSLNTCVKHIEPSVMAHLLQQGQDDWVTQQFPALL